jgi:hypothetical protein
VSEDAPWGESIAQRDVVAGIDTSIAHPARMYDYFLGGKNNFPADREAAEANLRILPTSRAMARANRAFLGRAVRHLAAEGFTQFLDLGTGIPGPGNTGETARAVHPDARIVYVDNDPIVAAHSRALLAGADSAATAVVQADVRQPAAILNDPTVRSVLDFDRPIAVLLVAVLHFVRDTEDPLATVRTLMAGVAPGSRLVLTHGTGDFDLERSNAAVKEYDRATAPFVLRSKAEIAEFFDDLSLIDPGLVQIPWWRPDNGVVPQGSEQIWLYGGVGIKG